MKFLLLIVILLFSTLVFGGNCDNYHLKSDLEQFGEKKKLHYCSLEWKGGGLQWTHITKGCVQFEGSQKQDCSMIRTCPKDIKGNYRKSATLFEFRENQESTLCFNSRKQYELFRDENNAKAIVNCQDGKIKSLSLISPSGVKKDCSLSVNQKDQE